MPEEIVCTSCGIKKTPDNFHKDYNNKKWHRSDCKLCHLAKTKAYNERKILQKRDIIVSGKIANWALEVNPFILKKSKLVYTAERKLNEKPWSYPKESEYEKSWKSEAIDLNRPHPALYEHKKYTT